MEERRITMYDNTKELLEDLELAKIEIREQKKTIKALTEVIAQLYFKYVPAGTEVKLRKKVEA